MKVKVAVIGTGHLGSVHAKLWKTTSNAELVGVYDIFQDKSQHIAREHNCKSFSSIDEALDNVDAVTIAVPTSLHFGIAKQCIERNVHCFIEKPITSTYLEAKQLIRFASENKVIIQVGHVERFNPALSALSYYPLEPLFIEVHRLAQFKPRAIDVSVVHDLMIHDIDIMLWLIKSEVKKIDANGVAVLTDTTDIANARISFKNGAVANLTASRISAKPMRKMRIFQKNAYISLDFAKQDVEIYRIAESDEIGKSTPATMLGSLELGIKNKSIIFEKPVVESINAIAEEQKFFVQSIINKDPIAVSAAEAAEALKIAELINEQIIESFK